MVLDSIFFVGFTTVVLLSIFFSTGFTTVVLFSVFFSAGGLTVVVFCSHAPKSAALARMEISFFISLIGLPVLKSQQGDFSALRTAMLSSSSDIRRLRDWRLGIRLGSSPRRAVFERRSFDARQAQKTDSVRRKIHARTTTDMR